MTMRIVTTVYFVVVVVVVVLLMVGETKFARLRRRRDYIRRRFDSCDSFVSRSASTTCTSPSLVNVTFTMITSSIAMTTTMISSSSLT
jgi:hypothetical protein